jgi:hypothetical protein
MDSRVAVAVITRVSVAVAVTVAVANIAILAFRRLIVAWVGYWARLRATDAGCFQRGYVATWYG